MKKTKKKRVYTKRNWLYLPFGKGKLPKPIRSVEDLYLFLQAPKIYAHRYVEEK